MAIVRLLIGILIGGAVGAVLGYFGKCSTGSCPLTANPFRGAIYGAVMGLLLALLLSAPVQRGAPGPEARPAPPRETMEAPANKTLETKENSENHSVLHIDNKSDRTSRLTK